MMKNKTVIGIIVMTIPCLMTELSMSQEVRYSPNDSLQQNPPSLSPLKKRGSVIPRESGTAATEVNIIIYKAELKEVSFSGAKYHEVIEDGRETLKYDAPHWQDNSSPLDGDADDPGDRKYPICFTRNSRMSSSATFIITPSSISSGQWKVRGTGPNALSFPEANATISGNKLMITNVNCLTPFSNKVDSIDLKIFWEVSSDGGKTWCKAGTSRNGVYLTLDDPVAGITLYETLLNIGCRNAKGRSNATDVVAAIWTDFLGPIPGVKRKPIDGHNVTDGVEMKYYVENYDALNDIIAKVCRSVQMMLNPFPDDDRLNGIGNCFAWAALFHETLRSQGVSGSQIFEVKPGYISPIRLNPLFDTGSMLVRHWSFAASGSAPQMCMPFSHLRDGEVTDLEGAPGQGTRNPPAEFLNHYIVKYNDKYYDPSYGSGPFEGATDDDAKNAWENVSLVGFVVVCATGDIVAKTNDRGKIETTFLPR